MVKPVMIFFHYILRYPGLLQFSEDDADKRDNSLPVQQVGLVVGGEPPAHPGRQKSRPVATQAGICRGHGGLLFQADNVPVPD